MQLAVNLEQCQSHLGICRSRNFVIYLSKNPVYHLRVCDFWMFRTYRKHPKITDTRFTDQQMAFKTAYR